MTKDEMDDATRGLPSKSAKIRTLASLGATRSEIASYLQIRYQHVRNVLVGPSPVVERERLNVGTPTIGYKDSQNEVSPLTIEQAKLGLAHHFGVPPTAIEITIRG